MRAYLLSIGDEILIGQIINTNAVWMAKQLSLLGIEVVRIDTVGDTEKDITNGIKQGLRLADIVLMTGGLGPTKDDITKKVIADVLGKELVYNEKSFQHISQYFERIGRPTTEAHKIQALTPEGVELYNNRVGTALPIWAKHRKKHLISMPGVPREMKCIMKEEILPRLSALTNQTIEHRIIKTVGVGETTIAAKISAIEDGLPPHISLAYLPKMGEVTLRFSGSGKNEILLNKTLDDLVEAVQNTIPQEIYGFGETTFSKELGALLKSKQKTIATAESCTGGYLAHQFTQNSGSSAYFMGSVIAYDNSVKGNVLKVNPKTLEKYGAVSEETIREMARGARQLMKTDYALATSGIAGPTGGTPEKPVGTIWIAIASNTGVKTKQLKLAFDREKNIHFTSVLIMNWLRIQLMKG